MHCDIVFRILHLFSESICMDKLKFRNDDPTYKLLACLRNLLCISHKVDAILWVVFERKGIRLAHVFSLPNIKEILAVLE